MYVVIHPQFKECDLSLNINIRPENNYRYGRDGLPYRHAKTFDFMCVPPELRCDFKNHASALCATPEACSIQITLLVLNQLTNRCTTVGFRQHRTTLPTGNSN